MVPPEPLGNDPVIERFRKGQVPLQGRMAAAQGALPLPPEKLLLVLFLLRKDPEEKVRKSVLQTVRELPEATLFPTLEQKDTHPAVLDFYARALLGRPDVLERILVNPALHDKTFAALAPRVPPELQSLLVLNQVRIMRHPAIAEALRSNPNLDASVRRRLEEIEENIARGGASTAAAGEEAATQAPDESAEAATGEAEPDEASPAEAGGSEEEAAEPEEATAAQEDEDLLEALDALESDVLEDAGEAEVEEALDEELAGEEGSLQVRIQNMEVNDKIKLARTGSAEARSLLIRESNKSIREAVLDSPKMTDQEIESFAGNRSLPEEVLRTIAQNRDWVKNYTIMHRLVTNPKAPVGVAMRFLSRLHPKDLKDLSKNRNIPAALRTVAKRMWDEKQNPKKIFKKKH